MFCIFSLCCTLLMACVDNVDFPIMEVAHIATPTSSSGQSRLTTDPEGNAILSWIEYNDTDTFQLQYAQLQDDDMWSDVHVISSGDNWFINWADFPAIGVLNDGSKAATWLQMRDAGTYDYDVHISTADDINNWNSSFIPHRDSIAAEHGFVSMIPTDNNEMMISWLDGRYTKEQDNRSTDQEYSHGHSGSMTLRTATFDVNGGLSEEDELDRRICDCCQTDMAMTTSGPIVVYRDRTDQEVRDISIVRKIEDTWIDPQPVYSDGWQIHGCPVNGPAVSAIGSHVIVAWYTGADDTSHVKAALSLDNGANFDLPIIIDDGSPLGRVDVTWLDDDKAIITWLENDSEDQAYIKSRWIHIDGTYSASQKLIKTSPRRQSGFPIMVKDKRGLLITWTEVIGKEAMIRTARIY